jgi:DegV family protein with EDD domain
VASLRAGRSVSTSQPTPAALRAAYDELAANGATEIVSIHLSEALSGTCGAARTAADNFSVPVRVVDSASIGLGLGFALRAAAAARDGAARGVGAPGDGAAAVDDVTAAVLACVGATSVLFSVDTLAYLRRGGRIGAAQAVVGAALSIKPILGIEAGRIEPVDKVRTSARALDRLVDLTLSRIPAPTALAVQHLGAADRAAVLAATLRERSGIEVEVAELGAAVGAHVGPGTLAVVAH